jgi:hypothetical protein
MSQRVQKLRSIEELSSAPVIVPPDQGFERFARHCARYWTVAPRVYPRGTFKFRSIEEAQAARERVTGDSVRQMRAGANNRDDAPPKPTDGNR